MASFLKTITPNQANFQEQKENLDKSGKTKKQYKY